MACSVSKFTGPDDSFRSLVGAGFLKDAQSCPMASRTWPLLPQSQHRRERLPQDQQGRSYHFVRSNLCSRSHTHLIIFVIFYQMEASRGSCPHSRIEDLTRGMSWVLSSPTETCATYICKGVPSSRCTEFVKKEGSDTVQENALTASGQRCVGGSVHWTRKRKAIHRDRKKLV